MLLAHICDLMGKGRVVELDLSHPVIPKHITMHPLICFIEGDACGNFNTVAKCIGQNAMVLIIEDSSHTYENTPNVLRLYSPLVTVGSYFIVEDGICRHRLEMGPDPGSYEAINTFINENTDFEIDRSKESFLITCN